jgi:hypothetical protein
MKYLLSSTRRKRWYGKEWRQPISGCDRCDLHAKPITGLYDDPNERRYYGTDKERPYSIPQVRASAGLETRVD